MAMQAVITGSSSIAGKTFPRNATITAEATLAREITLPVAKVGQLTTRTDADTGTLTMNTGHGITTGQIIDIYWEEAGVRGNRRGVTVGTVSVDSVPFGAIGVEGSGDALPTNLTAVTVQVVDTETLDLVGNNTEAYAVYMSGPGTVVFLSSGGAELDYHVSLADGAWSFSWDNENGYTNPLAGDTVASIRITQRESTTARTARVCALYN